MADLTRKTWPPNCWPPASERTSPGCGPTTEPIADTPMVVTLDQLRPMTTTRA